ncbi:MAG: Ig-like domain-containing protein [Oscillospiraceae bacterium]|nr:Ig-like domain-containing protein [Oscillospiraceae bacterium]
MAAKANLTKNADIDIKVREIDFVSRFNEQWEHLRQILNILRPIRKAAGTKLTSKYAMVALQGGNVAEGDEIPFSKATVQEKEYGTITIQKYAKAVSIEAIDGKGYDAAIQQTDTEFLNELQNKVTDGFYAFLLNEGTLRSTENTFQMAVSMAKGRVVNKWKKMHKSTTSVVGFCNDLDAYEYLGAAGITTQTAFGIEYLTNFLGFNTLILSAEIPRGVVVATPSENIINYYVDPSDSSFARAGLEYTTDGETNLIGFHAEGNYNRAQSESYALMGNTLFAEYLDGIAVVNFKPAVNIVESRVTMTVGATKALTATTIPANQTITWTSDKTSVATVSNGTITAVAKGTANVTATITVGEGASAKTYTDTVEVRVINGDTGA